MLGNQLIKKRRLINVYLTSTTRNRMYIFRKNTQTSEYNIFRLQLCLLLVTYCTVLKIFNMEVVVINCNCDRWAPVGGRQLGGASERGAQRTAQALSEAQLNAGLQVRDWCINCTIKSRYSRYSHTCSFHY